MMKRFMRTIKSDCIWIHSFTSFAQAYNDPLIDCTSDKR
jgi:hypothetical protein